MEPMTAAAKPILSVVRDFRPTELPTVWDDADGRAVEWTEWEPAHKTFICPPPKKTGCYSCGSVGPTSTAMGAIVPRHGEMFKTTEDAPSKRTPGRFSPAAVSRHGRKRMVPAWKILRLHATRCEECEATDIYDTDTDAVHVPPWDDPSNVTDKQLKAERAGKGYQATLI